MLFNSFQFFFFFIIVYLIYRQLSHKHQNIFLLISSYIFYGSWDWRFLFLIFISTAIDYFCGIKIYESNKIRVKKYYLLLSIILNLTLLGFFKYFNFFAENLINFLNLFEINVNLLTLNIILPVGISFYTFQTLTYSIDIYKNQLKPTRNFLDFALFVSFFPQLVAGPIERASNLLPQILNKRELSYNKARDGIWLIVWGLFKKIVIADNTALIVNELFAGHYTYTLPLVVLASYAFSIQIYCDFSAYSDIARGVSKILGFELMVNFNLPFFAKSPSDFWKRWHISLSTWLKDYLYIPLGGNKISKFITYRNLFITMLLGGLWHGAGWTFIIWGIYQGMLLILDKMTDDFFKKVNYKLPLNNFFKVLITYNLMAIGWLIFRSENIMQLQSMIFSIFSEISQIEIFIKISLDLLGICWPLILMQFVQLYTNNMTYYLKLPYLTGSAVFAFCLYMIFVYGVMTSEQFIYFQF